MQLLAWVRAAQVQLSQRTAARRRAGPAAARVVAEAERCLVQQSICVSSYMYEAGQADTGGADGGAVARPMLYLLLPVMPAPSLAACSAVRQGTQALYWLLSQSRNQIKVYTKQSI